MVKRLYKRHRQKINYLLVGIWNTIFGYSLFIALYYFFGNRMHYMLIWGVSTVLSITNAYFGYRAFVFQTTGNYWREYFKFYVVYSGSMVINLVLLPLCVEMFKISPPLAQGGLIFLSVGFSYFGHKHFSFRQKQQSGQIQS